MKLALLAAPVFLFSACATRTAPQTNRNSVATVAADRAQVTAAPLPRSPDVAHEVMGWLVVSDGDRLLRELLASELRGAPASRAEAQAFAALELDPRWAKVLDLKRPAGLGLLNPALLSSATVKPYLAMLPITSRAAVEEALAARGAKISPEPWGFSVDSALGRMCVGFAPGYALIAWRADLLDAARRLLAPKLAARADAPMVMHVEMENVYASFGPQMMALLANFSRLAERGDRGPDPSLVYALRGMRRLTRYVDSVRAFELLADVDSGGITLTARLDGKRSGAFTDFVREQQPGPAWGVRFLPRDSVMVFTTRASERGRADDAAAALQYLIESSSLEKIAPADVERWKKTLVRAAATNSGELAYAVWPAQPGGIGLGGAYRVSDPAAAREAVRDVYRELAEPIGQVALRALVLDPTRYAPRISVKERRARIADTDVDLVEVGVRWPASAEVEKKNFETLFGPKLVLATAFIDDQALFALGPDWSARLATMIGAARGSGAASMNDEPSFAEALSYREPSRVSLAYLHTDRMARFAASLVMQVTELDARQREEVAGLVAQVGAGAIVSTTNASDRRYELTTHVPHSAILGAARLSGALWRVALSPLVNPPTMPPMPLPPAHIMPPLSPPTAPAPSL